MRSAMIGAAVLAVLAGSTAQAGDPQDLPNVIEHQLDTAESRTLAPPMTPGSEVLIRRDRQVTGQNLGTLKTLSPNQPAVPLLERQYDRSLRPTGISRPTRGSRPLAVGRR